MPFMCILFTFPTPLPTRPPTSNLPPPQSFLCPPSPSAKQNCTIPNFFEFSCMSDNHRTHP
ncbi:UNVERIFIED_CONTAM: hypothetical protein FKN15_010288 [Acipenser sinensis]